MPLFTHPTLLVTGFVDFPEVPDEKIRAKDPKFSSRGPALWQWRLTIILLLLQPFNSKLTHISNLHHYLQSP